MRTFSGCVIYLIKVMATCYSFCFALLNVGAYNLSPRVKGHFCVLTLIVASTCRNEISLRGFFTADETQPLLHYYAFIIAHRLSFSPFLS